MSDKNLKTTRPTLSSSSSSSASCSFRLGRIFDIFDKDGDAIITVKEISEALSLLGLDAELREIDSLIISYIKPGNEGLTYEDFKALHESLGDTLFGFKENETAQEESELSEAFKVFDEDGDGYISPKELLVVLKKLELIEGNEIDKVQKMIFSVDLNRDGRVDFFEFKDMMRTALVPTS